MKISEQAKRASGLVSCYESEKQRLANIIQTAINSHERDLVEAATRVYERRFHPIDSNDYPALKAALDRRRE